MRKGCRPGTLLRTGQGRTWSNTAGAFPSRAPKLTPRELLLQKTHAVSTHRNGGEVQVAGFLKCSPLRYIQRWNDLLLRVSLHMWHLGEVLLASICKAALSTSQFPNPVSDLFPHRPPSLPEVLQFLQGRVSPLGRTVCTCSRVTTVSADSRRRCPTLTSVSH